MVLDIVVHKTDDGYTAEVPSLKGCETWAHDEDSVITKVVDLVAYYLKTDQTLFKIDKARGKGTRTVYKLIFSKSE
jgi:predicted RNase H-like HicB family nuclease